MKRGNHEKIYASYPTQNGRPVMTISGRERGGCGSSGDVSNDMITGGSG